MPAAKEEASAASATANTAVRRKKITAKKPASDVAQAKTATKKKTHTAPKTNGNAAASKNTAVPKTKITAKKSASDSTQAKTATKKKMDTASEPNGNAAASTNAAVPKTKMTAKKPASDSAQAKTAGKKKADTAPEPNGNAAASRKRKASVEATDETERTKKVKAETPAPRAIAVPKPKKVFPDIGKIVNEVPGQILDVYVFGEGTSGELGLGSKKVNGKKPIDVKRPRLNENLGAKSVGVIQIACGGMHAAALTRDHKILTWGVNDQGALGRDTNWDGGLKDMDGNDSDSDSDDDDTGINPEESTPTAVGEEYFAPGTKFVQVVASDSATFVLTQDGRVYGWGTFRSSDGVLGFTESIKIQQRPMLLPTLKNITALAAGSNHILALDTKGNVVAWGCGQQNQLGRRIIERNKMSSLTPQGMGLPRGKIAKIACGAYHSFAVDKNGAVWGWGLNNFGEIGVQSNAGEDDAVILKPAKLTDLEDHVITDIDGGVHHSLACSKDGTLFTWGRVDGYQVGFELDELNKDDVIFDERGSPRILVKPTVNPEVSGIRAVAAGSDNNFAVARDGKVYSWGFSSNYQTGQGTIEDITTPTQIDNTAIRGKQIIGAGAGGQFSVVFGKADAQTNGTH
ncbi:Regulator of chromosome condensation/beta-lactamase-inhibitor protein II [Cordyceps fumosorosea ARSEF 2679]|uniref:Regulator of chromosome condensation/beta-lactamase-inhibitor protein II n=1 Tax=Cordyceps fumosorosea (strain ARSEF 2679) TaxID=1081104 RepID=A0A168BYA7_CORFA|nr:Regulator of chromosome condensation/beta-lactamase-inhibitor protein II [Cordyceps fumosorosea ARSEF 2679]OAA70705.1 Regulator of chromosome condensation/beta-lactamase-inhibitor protein II [Cordyceps fumosorosea ARSEF 2679]